MPPCVVGMLRVKVGGVDSSGSDYIKLYNMQGITCVTEELFPLLEGLYPVEVLTKTFLISGHLLY